MNEARTDDHSIAAEGKPREHSHLVCERCGRTGAYALGDELICFDCYAQCGSCCQEACMEEATDD